MELAETATWVIPLNDGEAAEIVRVLVEGAQQVLVSEQGWGATWAGLEGWIQQGLEWRLATGARVYGVELQGRNPWGAIDIDHHRYTSEDRWRADSSLEQVLRLLGRIPSRWQVLVAANDKAYITGMRSEDATDEEIRAVRLHDRRLQGVTRADEERAVAEIQAAEWHGSKALVRCLGKITAAHSDLLNWRAKEWLLTGPATWEYSGPRHTAMARLCEQGEKWWSGGAASSGYFGVATPGSETQARILEFFINGTLLPAV